MRCRVPGCGTIYVEKQPNVLRFFRAVTETQLGMWREILLRYGVEDFAANDVICILHFKENDVEMYRTEYKTGGIAYTVPLKRADLRHNAVPTIFPSEIPITEKRRKLKISKYDCAIKLDDNSIAKQREIFQASFAIDAAKDKLVKKKSVHN